MNDVCNKEKINVVGIHKVWENGFGFEMRHQTHHMGWWHGQLFQLLRKVWFPIANEIMIYLWKNEINILTIVF